MGAQAEDKESLFGDDLPKASAKPAASSSPGIKGFIHFELARAVDDPEHWSKMRTRADLSSAGNLGADIKWKLVPASTMTRSLAPLIFTTKM
ncbi:MAG: hypothetical protein IPJ38_11725 [Dechloromonas sp.]|uniref:Uncharacterized protein n=1 Tax=Candidatus Dechloromonas phosphorivorans TaxID=2899244 RepID=A0A935JXT7_9RHOO|nr:hypothetical protein [Candidatus Dechloromonas phosphorivorans]